MAEVSLEHHLDQMLEAHVQGVQGTLDRFEERLRPNWAMISVIATLALFIITGFGVLVGILFTGVNQQIVDLRGDLKTAVAEGVRQTELRATKDSLDADLRTIHRRIDEMHADINTIDGELVRRRSEFVEVGMFTATVARLDQAVNDLYRYFTNLEKRK